MTVVLKAYTSEEALGAGFGVRLRGVPYPDDPSTEVGFVQWGPVADAAYILPNLDAAIEDYTGVAGNITLADVEEALANAEHLTGDQARGWLLEPALDLIPPAILDISLQSPKSNKSTKSTRRK